MNVNSEEFLTKFYIEFLVQKLELMVLRKVVVNYIANTDEENKKTIESVMNELARQSLDQIAATSLLGDEYLDDLTKGLTDQLKDILNR
jgi:hypothetical protein